MTTVKNVVEEHKLLLDAKSLIERLASGSENDKKIQSDAKNWIEKFNKIKQQ